VSCLGYESVGSTGAENTAKSDGVHPWKEFGDREKACRLDPGNSHSLGYREMVRGSGLNF
jgi:hypothetical protein